MENALALMKSRRSVRSYEPTPLPRETVMQLLEAAIYAPSGHNRQSWLFTAVINQKILGELNQIIRDGFSAMQPGPEDPVELHDAKKKAERLGEAYSFSYKAPCLIIASNTAGYHNGMADCACAMENMLLTACDLGLGGCWVNQLHWQDRNPVLRAYLLEQLHVPMEHTICGSAVFGIPSIVPKPSTRKEGTWQIID